ncbi:coenzyme F420-0:L-glutamate ligase [Halorientalis halophila]|uniref:coenzyme F420-0:L-glutamate ligase n=1 Tax=Halorientalis halophila TaxID=3108499 RepID=UPI003009D4EF
MHVTGISGLPEFESNDDIAALVEREATVREGDVLVVASTIVSKVEGRTADCAAFPASERAERIAGALADATGEERDPRFVQAVIEESEELLLETPFVLAVTPFGHVTVNAGIDRSNVPDADLLLLPLDPSASAARIRERLSVDASVVVTDTSGRPFRHGQRGVALGWAGMPANRDWRGEHDREGRELGATVQSVVDELAAAGNLVTGEGDGGRPVALVRDFAFGDHAGDDTLFRAPEDDVIRDALLAYSRDRKKS